MGKAKDVLKAFIADIPNDKLTGYPNKAPTTLYTDSDYRLDLQSVRPIIEEVSEKDKKGKTVKVQKEVGKIYNLQVQANKQSQVTSIRGIAPKTAAGPVIIELRNGKYSLSAKDVRSAFTSKILI